MKLLFDTSRDLARGVKREKKKLCHHMGSDKFELLLFVATERIISMVFNSLPLVMMQYSVQ